VKTANVQCANVKSICYDGLTLPATYFASKTVYPHCVY